MYVDYLKHQGKWEEFKQQHQVDEDSDPSNIGKMLKIVSRTDVYKGYVNARIAPGELASSDVGNLYTGSVFLSLVSCLESEINTDLSNTKIGFFAYGSGSKAKVFEATVTPGYRDMISQIQLFDRLDNRVPISFVQYEYLHKSKLLANISSNSRRVFHQSSGWTETNRYARNYAVV